ncbi:MAG: hypothetical protein LBR08_05480 [Bacteroidales bacterium]|jgi:hypothetical protein|nr:hypothetical protein [Bacteroidales bacterium]
MEYDITEFINHFSPDVKERQEKRRQNLDSQTNVSEQWRRECEAKWAKYDFNDALRNYTDFICRQQRELCAEFARVTQVYIPERDLVQPKIDRNSILHARRPHI